MSTTTLCADIEVQPQSIYHHWRKEMPKSKPKKAKKLNPLQRANAKVKSYKLLLEGTQREAVREAGNVEFRVKRFIQDIEHAQKATADKQAALLNREQTIAQRDAVIRLRDERIVDLVNERNRIVRLVDQFTSIQITSHGTQLSASINPAAPNNLRIGVPAAVVAQMQGPQTEAPKAQKASESDWTAAKVVETADSYRRRMYGTGAGG